MVRNMKAVHDNYFQSVKNNFHDMKNYFHDVKKDFQDMKIVMDSVRL